MSTMVMPMNYVSIDREEMTYIEGGGTLSLTLSKGFLTDCLYGAANITAGTIGFLAATALVAGSGWTLTALGQTVAVLIGAAVGNVLAGVISRNMITRDIKISVKIPFINNLSYRL